MADTSARPSTGAIWLAAARPRTLTAALAPVIVGGAAAFGAGVFRWVPFAAALFGAMCIQIGTNFANDVFDFEKGADTHERLGPVRATQAGWLAPRQVRTAMLVTFGLAVLSGIYLALVGGRPIVVIGLLSIASGIAYTGGPWPLGYHGLGDLFVFVFFGLVATAGTQYVVSGEFPWVGIAAGIPLGTLSTAILVVNNLRDRKTDAQVGKRTLAVRFGERFARIEYAVLLVAAYVSLPLTVAAGASWAVFTALASLPLAWTTWQRFKTADGAALNPVLGETARLVLVFAILLSAGLLIG